MPMRALQNITTGAVYPIVAIDTEANEITLQGEHGNFNEPYDVEKFHAMGYKRVSLDDNGKVVVKKKE